MERLTKYFRILLVENKMIAQVEYKDDFLDLEEELVIEKDVWLNFLATQKVVYGIQQNVISELSLQPSKFEYPIIIAKGEPPINGEEGKVEFVIDFENQINRDENWNFREVMKIPSVTKGQKLARIIGPTSGEDGKDVTGAIIKAKQGKAASARAGKNVVFQEESASFFAAEDGQFSLLGKKLSVHPEFEVNETLSLKNGNLDFVGTIVIHGDVPNGYTVKADGDIKIHGVVEGATIVAGGSIFIGEGIVGQGKGYLKAGQDIRLGYINQAEVYAGNNLFVENSIIHSTCIVNGHVFCQTGNIIGGSVSAGKSIEARDIGTKMNSKTEVFLGVNKLVSEQEEQLLSEKQKLTDLLGKLKHLGEKLATQNSENPQIRISLLRQRNSLNKTETRLREIEEELLTLNSNLGDYQETKLVVRNFIYQNVIVTFGKYKRVMKSDYHFVKMNTEGNEIKLHQLFIPETSKP
ncbi:DUF342 domain-containing protein [Oceanobacillus sp. CAU 1775]